MNGFGFGLEANFQLTRFIENCLQSKSVLSDYQQLKSIIGFQFLNNPYHFDLHAHYTNTDVHSLLSVLYLFHTIAN
jgi:hypothetical protein